MVLRGIMRLSGLALAWVFAFLAQCAVAQDMRILGVGRLFSNDLIGDGQDRWRTGSYSFSVLTGQGWDGRQADGPVLEYRLRTDIITPWQRIGRRSDRPYAGSVSLGLHHHSRIGPTEVSVGADLVLIGPQTGLSDFQQRYHDWFSFPAPLGVDSQLGNATQLSGTADVVWPVSLGPMATVRPFIEAQAGVENILRVGTDVVIGPVGQHDKWLRDGPTGQLYRGIQSAQTGFGFVVGADLAQVNDSAFLSAESGYFVEPVRWRARAGLHWQPTPDTALFYGLAWLSPEFEGQEEGQVIGQLRLDFNF
jgi:hypothetical protein